MPKKHRKQLEGASTNQSKDKPSIDIKNFYFLPLQNNRNQIYFSILNQKTGQNRFETKVSGNGQRAVPDSNTCEKTQRSAVSAQLAGEEFPNYNARGGTSKQPNSFTQETVQNLGRFM